METLTYKVGGLVFTSGQHLAVLDCKTCGVPYAIPYEMHEWARTHREVEWYCPNGHGWHYPGKTDEEKLKAAQDRLARERAAHDQTRASLQATKGAATRARNERDQIKTRVAAGVCPCCGRTFQQLARHMENKHPNYATAEA